MPETEQQVLTQLAGLEGWIVEALLGLRYVGLALVVVMEHVFPPIPSEVVLPFAGFLVSRGYLSFGGAVLGATIGSVLGASVLYALARWGGRPVILRYGSILQIDERSLAQAEAWFQHWGDWIVLLARIVPLGRSAVSVPAGSMRMPWIRFATLTAAGSTVWNVALIGAGWLLGENWATVSRIVSTYSHVAAPLLVLGLVSVLTVIVVRSRLRRRRESAAGNDPAG